MLNRLKNLFVSGIIAFLPIALSIYVITGVVRLFENFLGNFLKKILPEGEYIPGFGLLATILLVLLLGFLVNNLVTATFFARLQEKLREIPLIKTVYSPLRDLMNLFAQGQKDKTLQKVVLVHLSPHHSVIGLVTRETFSDLNINHTFSEEKIAVYIPMSYGLGGYTVLMSKSQLEPLDIPIEKAMTLALTAWIKTDSQNDKTSSS